MFKINNNKVVKFDNSRANKIVKNLFKSKNSKNIKFKILIYTNIQIIGKFNFFTLGI